MVKFVLEELGPSREAEPKTPLSTSLPQRQLELLNDVARRLRRGKAVLFRTSLHLLFSRDEAERENILMSYYRAGRQGPPKPLTTTLTLSQKENLSRLAMTLHRPKADLVRAALFDFFNLTAADQERAVIEYLSAQ